MEILPNIHINDLGLYLKNQKALVIGDVHIGYEEALNKQGLLIPRFQFKEVIKRLEKILEKTKPELIIINGDLKHEFGVISETEWRYTLRLIDFLVGYGKVILIKGNHDKIIGPIADKKNIIIKNYYFNDKIYICHGHEIPKNKDFDKAKKIIIGHEHPAVSLKDHGRVEKYKCFLKGKHKDKKLIVMPSFNLVTEGKDILTERLLSPFLKEISDFEVFVAEKKIMYFGKIMDLLIQNL
ncbi:metallophosphoesterase [Candidatus Woesearchaeota archaeon]|nr:metallophosphoesterase [Candidatus Woesearchaeota archaeon]